jgi:hypothetical protein
LFSNKALIFRHQHQIFCFSTKRFLFSNKALILRHQHQIFCFPTKPFKYVSAQKFVLSRRNVRDIQAFPHENIITDVKISTQKKE